MLAFINFAPLNPTHKRFFFLLHPHLKRKNIIDDDLLQLPFLLDDEARIQLWGSDPTIRSTRADLGIYLNHQLLGSIPSLLRDGDIVAFPQRRHDLKTAVRFRVELESMELSCGVDQELLALRWMAQEMMEEEEHANSTGMSSDSSEALDTAAVETAAPEPRTFSYAALVGSNAPHRSGHSSSTSPVSLVSPSSSTLVATPPASTTLSISSATAVAPTASSPGPCASTLSPLAPRSTSVLTSGVTGLKSVPASSSLVSTPALGVITPLDVAVAHDSPTSPAYTAFEIGAPKAIQSTLPARPMPIAPLGLCSADRALAHVATAWATARRWVYEDSVGTVPCASSHDSPFSERKTLHVPISSHPVPTVTSTGSDAGRSRSSVAAHWLSPMASRGDHSSPSILEPLLAVQSILLELLRALPWYHCGNLPAR